MLRSHFISTPVSVENTPEEIVVETIKLDIWLLLKYKSKSVETDINSGNSWERLIPYKIEQLYVANKLNPKIAIKVHMIPVSSWAMIREVSLQLLVPRMYPNTNRKIVLRVQNIEVNLTASCLL